MKQVKIAVIVCISVFLSIGCLCFGAEDSVTGILGGFSDEVALLEEELTDGKERIIEGIRFVTGEIRGRCVTLAQTGMGKVNAAMVATLLIEHFRPSEVIFTGIAGGLNPDLLVGDMVIAERTAQHDFGALTPFGFHKWGAKNPVSGRRNPVFFPADPRLLVLAETSGKRVEFEKIEANRAPRIIRGIIVTGDVFVSSSSKKAELRKNFQADAVEMEGAAVAQICWQQDVPCLVTRCLSDIADENAGQDCRKFYTVAARNSAKLVIDLVEQLASLEK